MMRVKWTILLCTALFAGCAEEPLGELDEIPLISANNLDADHLAANLPPVRVLLGSRLGPSPSTAQMVDTPEGRNVLTYLTRCALGPGQSIWLRGNTTPPVQFWGNDGVYPGWLFARPAKKDIECINGCMAAHLNGLNTSVDISIRGEACRYPVTADEHRDFQVEEMAAAGDVEVELTACVGAGLRAACGNSAAPTLAKRICATRPELCGDLRILGDCGSVCAGKSPAGAYFGCKDGNKPLDGMVTVWLEGGIPYPCVH
jgi:hypothetical protein